MHGRPSWELAPYERESEQNGPKISSRGVEMPELNAPECCFNERTGECVVVRFTSQFFVLDKSKSIPIRIGGQTAWEAVRNDLIKNKEKIASKDYDVNSNNYGCAVLFC